MADTKKRFFVRVSGKVQDVAAVENIFGAVEVVQAGVDGEYGFVTPEMSEAKYQEKAERLTGILGMLRIRD